MQVRVVCPTSRLVGLVITFVYTTTASAGIVNLSFFTNWLDISLSQLTIPSDFDETWYADQDRTYECSDWLADHGSRQFRGPTFWKKYLVMVIFSSSLSIAFYATQDRETTQKQNANPLVCLTYLLSCYSDLYRARQ